MAVCNTLAVSAFHSAFRAHRVEVLSWIHELPTFIGLLGGDAAIEEIKLASRKIMVPSQAVRAALSTRFRIDAASIRTVYNGQDPRTEGLDREALRLEIRRELGLPRGAGIVLGCGTIDLRKGADLFVNLARRVLLEERLDAASPGTWFLWVGHGGEDNLRRWLLHDSRIGGMEERIRFIGPQLGRPLLHGRRSAGADFARGSVPAGQHGSHGKRPPRCRLLGRGGAPEVLGDAGVCVPYLDVSAMAAAVRELLADKKLRSELGRRGRTRIRGQFTWNRFMGEFRDILQTEFHYRPSLQLKVSVIVPNYRHAKYLDQRIQSVFDQTLKPHEIIVLDDASPDLSVQVAEAKARQSTVPMRIVVNQENSGSTFHQWLKGLSLATGDLIWFAESDDAAHSMFLERLVPEFFDPDVILAYCQSAPHRPPGRAPGRRLPGAYRRHLNRSLARPLFGRIVNRGRNRSEPKEHDSQRQRRRVPPAQRHRLRGRAAEAQVRRRLALLCHADPRWQGELHSRGPQFLSPPRSHRLASKSARRHPGP